MSEFTTTELFRQAKAQLDIKEVAQLTGITKPIDVFKMLNYDYGLTCTHNYFKCDTVFE